MSESLNIEPLNLEQMEQSLSAEVNNESASTSSENVKVENTSIDSSNILIDNVNNSSSVSDEVEIVNEKAKSIISQYTSVLKCTKDKLCDEIEKCDKIINDAYSTCIAELESIDYSSKDCIPRCTSLNPTSLIHSSVFDSDYHVIVGFVNSDVTYSIPLSVLSVYPSNIIYQYFLDGTHRNSKNEIFLDHDDILFTYIIEYMKTGHIDFEEIGDTYIYQLYSDLSYYHLPIPLRIRYYKNKIEIEKRWNMPEIKMEVNHIVYTINRSRLASLHIMHSYFNNEPDLSLDYHYNNDVLIMKKPVRYFKYIVDYIQNGVLDIESEDLDYIQDIKKEFSVFNINMKEEVWIQYLPVSSYFPDSNILNDNYINILLEWIGKDKKWKLLYKGSRDGFLASEFHEKCDEKGENIVLIRNNNNGEKNVFGGYTSKSWLSYRGYTYDEKAFLFTLKNPFNLAPLRLPCINPAKAIFNSETYGPVFGDGNDIVIKNECNMERGGWINCLGTKGYANKTDQGNSLFVNTGNPTEGNFFKVDEIEVYGL
ncbi:hypothetical protein WA158_007011 [Blastocystis sp. Blastoise]